jgi:hypothetical protein
VKQSGAGVDHGNGKGLCKQVGVAYVEVFKIGQFRFASKVQKYSNLAANSPLSTSTSKTSSRRPDGIGARPAVCYFAI